MIYNIIIWLLCGLVPTLILTGIVIYDTKPEDREWCPSPMILFFFLLGVASGPVSLFLGCIILIFAAFEWLVYNAAFQDWWTHPICQKRKKKYFG